MDNERIVVCCKCGALYDLHYVDKVKIRQSQIVKFECNHCGMVDVVIKDALSSLNSVGLNHVDEEMDSAIADIPRIEACVKRKTIKMIREFIKEKKEVSMEDLMAFIKGKNITEMELDEFLSILERNGDVFQPRKNWYKIMQE